MADKRPRVLVPTGYGLNCEEETAYGYRLAGADADIVHINDVISSPKILEDYHILALIGGFADGDHIASGKVHANRLKYRLGGAIEEFIENGKLVIGVCNGFQTMVKYGLLPAIDKRYRTETVTLTYNDSGKFEDRWVHLLANSDSKCVWTRNVGAISLPVRHGEGKLRAGSGDVMETIVEEKLDALHYINPHTQEIAKESDYPYNPNGSAMSIAGLCDPTGRVFGMMPHWEAYLSPYNHPLWQRLRAAGKLPEQGLGLKIGMNGVEYAREELL